MQLLIKFFILFFMLYACANAGKFPKQPVEYPVTENIPVVDNYFGTKVVDNYRWLEDDLSDMTTNWVKAQNQVTYEYLNQIPFRKKVRERFNILADYENYGSIRKEYRLSLPININGNTYYFKNIGLQNHAVMYAINQATKEETVVLDPNTFSEDGTVSLSDVEFSENGKFIAYTISEGGSDWRKIIVIDANTLSQVEEAIVDVKFTSIIWNKDEGFFYSRYEIPEEGSVLSGVTDKHMVYYHKLGTTQLTDKLIYGNKDEIRRYVGVNMFEESDYLFLSAAESTSGNELYVKKGIESKDKFISFVEGFENDNTIIYAKGEEVYIFTNYLAPNGRIVKASVKNKNKKDWVDVIAEKDETIQSVNYSNGNIYVHYLKDAVSKVFQYTINGQLVREVILPGVGSVTRFFGDDNSDDVFYSFESFTIPYSIYILNAKSGESNPFKIPELEVDFSQYETKQIFYTSKDGTKVPMFIISSKGTKPDSNNPTLLYAYGGFNISLSPYFSLRWLAWLDMGGVLAIPNIRGGGEYGEEWHKAGMQMNKQNVFDDFIAAAEYLQTEGYTSKEKLAIMGGSNGGLLVGAVMTQRPDLMQVALPAVGVLDMLRYHKFTAGAGWISDYGCADSSKAMFNYLKAYSPVHNVKKQTTYPATMVTTGDHDDRVVPAHSFKFIAQLQEKQVGDLPVLIRIETDGGHGAGKSTSMILDELTDEFVFAFYNMGIKPAYFKE